MQIIVNLQSISDVFVFILKAFNVVFEMVLRVTIIAIINYRLNMYHCVIYLAGSPFCVRQNRFPITDKIILISTNIVQLSTGQRTLVIQVILYNNMKFFDKL